MTTHTYSQLYLSKSFHIVDNMPHDAVFVMEELTFFTTLSRPVVAHGNAFNPVCHLPHLLKNE